MAGRKPDRVLMNLLMHPADRDLLNTVSKMTGLDVAEVIARSVFVWQCALLADRMGLGSGIHVDVEMPEVSRYGGNVMDPPRRGSTAQK